MISRRLLNIHLTVFSLSLLIIACSASEKISKVIQIHGKTMGTTYSVVVPNSNLHFDKASLSVRIDNILTQIIEHMSTYIKDSSLSKFNQSLSTDWIEMPVDVIDLVNRAADISEKTDGAYDITIAPVVNLWGFGPLPRSPDAIPSEDQIKNAMSQVGYQKLQNQPNSLKKDDKNLAIDLSSIAKGYAVDSIGEAFESQGIRDYLVEIGGELRTRGNNPRGEPWRIGIVNPSSVNKNSSEMDAPLKQAIRLKNNHIATSGDYRNYFEKDGIRYSHTIDARTGKPISHHLASVTVAHASTAAADAWATALMVLGEKAGYDKAIEQNISAYFVYREEQNYNTKYTPGFKLILESVK